ncbi:SMEK domain-containing protein [Mucilaginibacter sp. AW1-7]|uniref:SMEK domain-containing protein n=1 Tax=Mucilaginibacter sp. AW1-7 TaxID=3349874 RepID=UPI003F740B69
MSNHNKLLVSIRDYLARFQLQVKIATANSEYDINQHAENIIIPIFNIVFEAKFRNANDSEKKNFESLDLIDDELSLTGIQVTSTRSLEKIKSTLTQFIKSGLQKRVKRIYIYILTEKQNSYSQEAVDVILKGRFQFDTASHILDATDLYGLIKSLNDVHLFQRINELLEVQFSDLKIAGDFNYTNFETFRASYKEKCINNFTRLNFFGLSVSKRPREVELYELFVPPLFSDGFFRKANHQFNYIDKISKFEDIGHSKLIGAEIIKKLFDSDAKNSHDSFLTYKFNYSKPYDSQKFENLFSLDKHLVILGNPGAGKSSIVKYAICKILENDESIFDNNDIYRYLPFRIELHKYNLAKVGQGGSFAEFMVQILATEYQTNISLERMLKILTFFSCLIFFDGIDEIFDIQERVNVRNEIENFVSTYPDARVVVTSRYESYEEVSFSKFQELEVRNFNEEQLEDYVHKWYKQEESNNEVRKKEIAGCLSQLKHVDNELKYNPLLLSLILILYRNELELPTNKLSIYEGCTNTIVEHRDEKEKKLRINLQISNKTSVFSSIAFWQFDNSNKKLDSITVQRHVKQYLMTNGDIEDEHEAEKAAIEFLDFAKLRSIYFENKFTHKTFLEYFTAYYIFSQYYIGQNQRRFNEILDRNVGLSSWTVVLELLICKIDSNLIDSRAMAKIIETQLEKNSNDALLFFLQLLRYLTNVNEKISHTLISLAIKRCFDDYFPLKESKVEHRGVLLAHLSNIYFIPRFRNAFLRAFEGLLQNNQISVERLVHFAYEFSNPIINDEFIALAATLTDIEESPELFLLRYFKTVDTEEKYLSLMKTFVQKFGPESLAPIYFSNLGQPIFFGNAVFNWIISFFLSATPDKGYEQYNKLKAAGLSQATIRKSINHQLLTKKIIEPYTIFLNGLPISGYRDFLQTLTKPFRKKNQVAEPKFYTEFYKDYKKK